MASSEVVKSDSNCCTPTKKAKLDVQENENGNIHSSISDLSSFKIEKVLHNNTNRKSICLQGSFETTPGNALVLLEKTAFCEENLKPDGEFFSKTSTLHKVFHNDIYGDYKFYPKAELNSLKTTIIHPATDKHIDKYTVHNSYMVNETPQLYQDIVLPHVLQEQLNLQWVYNILDHKSEADRIVFEDTDPDCGFILVPDLKWNGDIETLYLLAIAHKHDIKSIRDLTEQHLPLLKNIQDKATEAIKSKYGLDGSQLRIYLHYQPSFYHLHIHFTYLRHEAPGILAERAHLLTNVISNIQLLQDYYQKVTIPFVVRENDKLFTKFEKKAVLKKVV